MCHLGLSDKVLSNRVFKIDLYKITRFINLGLKFVPILFLPIYLSIADIGLYGVTLGYISTLTYIQGFELWYFFNRELVLLESVAEKEKHIAKQNSYYFINYLIVLPIFFLLIREYNFYLILVLLIYFILNHLTQELYRILISLEMLLASSILNLIKLLWVVFLFIGCITSVEAVFYYLTVFTFLAFVYALWIIYYKCGIKYYVNINLTEISFNILKKSFPIMVMAFCLQFLSNTPRFILKSKEFIEFAGIFSYFQTIANVIMFFTQSFIVFVYNPKLIKDNKNVQLLAEYKKQMLWGNLILTMLACVGVFVLTYFILPDKIYYNYIEIAFVIIIATAFISYSAYYTSVLYVNHADNKNVNSVYLTSLMLMFVYVIVYFFVGENILFILSIVFLIYALCLCFMKFHYAREYEK